MTVLNFAVQYSGLDAASLAASGHDLLIIEGAPLDAAHAPISDAEVAALQASGKAVAGYVNLSVTDDARPYWDPAWTVDGTDTGALTAAAPAWLVGATTNAFGYVANYWDQSWQELVIAQAVDLVSRGYGAVFLDDVGGYWQSYVASGASDVTRYASDMVALIKAVHDAVSAVNPDAQVIVNGDPYLVWNSGGPGSAAFADFGASIDYMLLENLFGLTTGTRQDGAIDTALTYIADVAGLLALESSTDPSAIAGFAAEAQSLGIVASVAMSEAYDTLSPTLIEAAEPLPAFEFYVSDPASREGDPLEGEILITGASDGVSPRYGSQMQRFAIDADTGLERRSYTDGTQDKLSQRSEYIETRDSEAATALGAQTWTAFSIYIDPSFANPGVDASGDPVRVILGQMHSREYPLDDEGPNPVTATWVTFQLRPDGAYVLRIETRDGPNPEFVLVPGGEDGQGAKGQWIDVILGAQWSREADGWTEAHVRLEGQSDYSLIARSEGDNASTSGGYFKYGIYRSSLERDPGYQDETLIAFYDGVRRGASFAEVAADPLAQDMSGTDFRDQMAGGQADDRLFGLDGDDVIEGGAGADLIHGGDGSDSASYRNAGAAVRVDLADDAGNTGEAAGDTLIKIENLIGSGFDDALFGDEGSNRLFGGAGADLLDGRGGFDTVSYDGSAAAVTVNLTAQTASGGDASGDQLAGFEAAEGSDYNDRLIGSALGNTLTGGRGADTLSGLDGDDDLYGGTDNDRLYGGEGDDRLDGGDGIDLLVGGAGADTLTGGAGHDRLYTNDGDDTVYAGDGNDRAWGQLGNDTLYGEGGADLLNGMEGDDTLHGGDGNDRAYGGLGNDFVFGGLGNDIVHGASGNDYLDGEAGNDRYYGGEGADIFAFVIGSGVDTIYDFEQGTDVIALSGYGFTGFDDLAGSITRAGTSSVRISLTGEDAILLRSSAIEEWDASDFTFA
ncbi:MAG: heparin lyase I family protein [Neomegalonema sp.]|nr:heparin lyase I family protein [Neomegalonema sp.]